MDIFNKLKYVENLVYCRENTTNIGALLTNLVSTVVISREDRELIISRDTTYQQADLIYDLLMKKPPECNAKILKALNDSGNSHVSAKITENRTVFGEKIWFGFTNENLNIDFVGRKDKMQKLKENCLNNKKSQFIVLYGMGGMGKSELAKQFALFYSKEILGNCFWLNAENSESLMTSLQSLIREEQPFGSINPLKKDGNEKDLFELSDEIFQRIVKTKSLLIFDNVEDYEGFMLPILRDLRKMINKIPPDDLKSTIIITTRYRRTATIFGNQAVSFELDSLKLDESMELMQKYLDLEMDETEKELSKSICERVDNLPLALHQAGSYIKMEIEDNGSTADEVMQDYLVLMDDSTEAVRIFDHQIESLSLEDDRVENRKTVYMTWKITINKLKRRPDISSAIIDGILNSISVMSPDAINQNLILNIVKTKKSDNKPDPKDLELVLKLLFQYSIIKLEKKNIYVHRLVQDVVRFDLQESENMETTVDDCLKYFYEKFLLSESEVPYVHMIHLNSVWGFAEKSDQLIKKYADLPSFMVKKYNTELKYLEGYEFACRALISLKTAFGEDNYYTVRMMHEKRQYLQNRKENFKEALEIAFQIRDIQLQYLEESHPYYLETCSNIGYLYLCAGMLDESLKTLTDNLEACNKYLPEVSYLKCSTKSYLGMLLSQMGCIEGALNIHQETYDDYTVLDKDRNDKFKNFNATTCQENIGIGLLRKGEFLEAYNILLKVQDNYISMFGPKYDRLGKVKYWMASALHQMGETQKALAVCTEGYELESEIYSYDPERCATLGNKRLMQQFQLVLLNNTTE